jgi:hypothetical protein
MATEAFEEGQETSGQLKDGPVIAGCDSASVITKDLTRTLVIIFVAALLLIPTCLMVVIMYLQILCKSAANISNELLELRELMNQMKHTPQSL